MKSKRIYSTILTGLAALPVLAQDMNDMMDENAMSEESQTLLIKITIVAVFVLFLCLIIWSIRKYYLAVQKKKRRAIRRRHYHEARDRYYRHHPEELAEKYKNEND